jgi:trimeric autotransporter adhesin
MKPLVIFLLLSFSTPTISQISFFKQLNDVEEGSYPANFTEFKGEVYFTVRTVDGNRLWKTDGTEEGTVQVSELTILNQFNYGIEKINFSNKLMSVCNNELYFGTYKFFPNYSVEIWKTDGISIQKADGLNTIPEFGLNNNLILPEYNNYYPHKRQILNNNLVNFKVVSINNSDRNNLEIWKNNGLEGGNTLIDKVDSVFFGYPKEFLYENNTLLINNEVYFFSTKWSDDSFLKIELWKTDGNIITKVSSIFNHQNFSSDNIKVVGLSNFNGKLIFLLNDTNTYLTKNTPLKLWISDPNLNQTNQIGSISGVKVDENNRTFGISANKFCFANEENGDTELWVSDGTDIGTQLLKNLNLNSSSNPHNFESINGMVYFVANNNEFWQTDGTQAGTILLSNIPKPADAKPQNDKLEYIFSNNRLIFKNYSDENGYELWKFGGNSSSPQLIKNIVTNKLPSIVTSVKVKLGSFYYFNGCNSSGCELWKTDGTISGTTLLKDLNIGPKGTQIYEMIVADNLIYFTGQFSGESNYRLFQTDGTEVGTIEIPLVSGHPTIGVNPSKLRAFGNSVIFHGLFVDTERNYLTSSYFKIDVNSTSPTIYKLPSTINNFINPVIINNYFYFLSNNRDGVYKLDLLTGQSERFFGTDSRFDPRLLTVLNSKLYFLSYIPNNNFLQFERGLFQSDGTSEGTTLVKSFINDPTFLDDYYLFLEKSDNRLYFRANRVNYDYAYSSFELWSSDGTSIGTYKIKTIDVNHPTEYYLTNLNFKSNGNTFYLFNQKRINSNTNQLEIWATEGYENNASKLFDQTFTYNPTSYSILNNKLYFSTNKYLYGTELWETDGTILGTKLTAEIRPGQPNSQIGNLMNFDDKLIMSGTDGNGIALWQYIDNTQIKSIKSGNWDDPSTWNTGQVPVVTNNVTIDENHTVVIPAAIQANLYTIIIKVGGILEIGNGASLNLNK